MRITRVRLISQIFFIGLALFFAFITQFSYLKGYPVSLFLEVDPLVAIASSISAHTLYRSLILVAHHSDSHLVAGKVLLQLDLPIRNPASIRGLAV